VVPGASNKKGPRVIPEASRRRFVQLTLSSHVPPGPGSVIRIPPKPKRTRDRTGGEGRVSKHYI
jgi:hypothetical protein